MKRLFWAGPAAFAAFTTLAFMPYGVSAALQVFTDRALFLAAAGPTVYTEDFSTAKPGTIGQGQTPMFGTLGFSYLGRPDGGNGDPFMGQPLIQDNGFINNSREFMGEVNADGTPSGIHTFSFPKPVFAFGADFGGALTGALLTVTAAGQTVKLSDYMPAPGTGFFGFTSTTDFAAISFGTEKSSGSEVFRLDDVSYASRVQQPLPVVPLPASVWFLLFGAGSLGAARTFLNTKPNNRVNRTS